MRIFIEDWIREQNFNETVNRLFEESILCYQAKAYRASLLFSFTAFQKILKFRLINASIPKSYEGKVTGWERIVKELSNEDRMDQKIKQCVDQNKEDNQIFLISEDIRNQYTYWKDRRNDCAHGKSNLIDVNHVESFWLFLKSNLPKFQVNGGKESLFNRVKDYFDDDVTPINADPTDIIKDISHAVMLDECEDFYNNIIDEIKLSGSWDWELLENKHKKLLLGLFTLSTDYRNTLVKVLEKNPIIFLELLNEDTKILQYINKNFVRILWRKHLKNYGYEDYKIVIDLLKFDLIPINEKEEFFDFTIDNFGDKYFINANEFIYQTLKEFGFIKAYEQKAFIERKINDFKWSEKNKNLIVFYIKYTNDYNENFIQAIEHAFNGVSYPYKLKVAIRRLFKRDSSIYKRFKDAFEEKGYDIPKILILE